MTIPNLYWNFPSDSSANNQIKSNGISGTKLSNADPDYGSSLTQLSQLGIDIMHAKGFHGENTLITLLDNGFLTLKEDTQQYASPISSIFYQQYDSLAQLQQQLTQDTPLLQCIVSNGCIPDSIGFGQTQKPSLSDYADGIDTMEFLTKLG